MFRKKKLKILIVDDRNDDIKHVTSILKKKGHTVIPASNGADGIKLAESEQPDVILMDVVMPDLNGFQATREICRSDSTRDIPVIVVSCKDEDVDKMWAFKQGASAYLTKGYDEKALFNTIDTVIADKKKGKAKQKAELC